MKNNEIFPIADAYPALQSSENLFVDFLSTISVESTGLEALDQVAELENLVTAHVHTLKGHKSSNSIVKDVRYTQLLNALIQCMKMSGKRQKLDAKLHSVFGILL